MHRAADALHRALLQPGVATGPDYHPPPQNKTIFLAVQVTSSALEAVRQIKAEVQDLLVRIGAIRQVLLARLLPHTRHSRVPSHARGLGLTIPGDTLQKTCLP